jgi:hypothetical protein
MTVLMLWLIGLAGMAAHWVKRWARGQTATSFREYFFVVDRNHSVAAVITMTVSVATFLSAWDGVWTMQSAALVFLAGYASDSAANQG